MTGVSLLIRVSTSPSGVLSKRVNWAREDVLSRGEEPGSGFDFDIGDYGVGTLELNIQKLFPPLEAYAWLGVRCYRSKNGVQAYPGLVTFTSSCGT